MPRRDHAPIVAVDLRVTVDFRTPAMASRYELAIREQAKRNTTRSWREFIAVKRAQRAQRERLPGNVILFGSAAKP